MALAITRSKRHLVFGIIGLLVTIFSVYRTISVAAYILPYELYFHNAHPCGVSQLGDPRCIVTDTLTVTDKDTTYSYGSSGSNYPDYYIDLVGSTGTTYREELPRDGKDYTSVFYDTVHVGDKLHATLWLQNVLTLQENAAGVTVSPSVNYGLLNPWLSLAISLFVTLFFGWVTSAMLIVRSRPKHRK